MTMASQQQKDVAELLKAVLARWDKHVSAADITTITPDASLRRYYRVHLAPDGASKHASIVAMVFDSVACPEVGGGVSVTSDEAYVELTAFFQSHGIAVPTLLYDARDVAVLLIEDLGDVQLADLLLGQSKAVSEEEIDRLYTEAIDQITALQALPVQQGFFPFERAFTAELYLREMSEFTDYLLEPRGIGKEIIASIRSACDQLARQLDGFPKVLVHRDFHPWNLLVDAKKRLRVIDYQDALMGTGAYDIVALLNDRDADALVGEPRYLRLLDYFRRSAGRDDSFYFEYDRVLLQRDLKVAGRFSKLSSVRGLTSYERWIPGTLRRIGRTLERITAPGKNVTAYGRLFELLVEHLPDVKQGAAQPLRFL